MFRHFIFCLVLVQPRNLEKSQHDKKIVDWGVKHQHKLLVPKVIVVLMKMEIYSLLLSYAE